MKTTLRWLLIVLAASSWFASNAAAQQRLLPPVGAISWTMGSKLGLAAVASEAGAPQKNVANVMQKAETMAKALGTQIPALPDRGNEKKATYSAKILHYILEGTKPIGMHLAKSYGTEAAHLLFEISLKSWTLAMLYAPGGKTGLTVVSVVEDRAKRARLPKDLWQPLVEVVKNKASYEDVKKTLSAMHSNVQNYLMAAK